MIKLKNKRSLRCLPLLAFAKSESRETLCVSESPKRLIEAKSLVGLCAVLTSGGGDECRTIGGNNAAGPCLNKTDKCYFCSETMEFEADIQLLHLFQVDYIERVNWKMCLNKHTKITDF